MVSGRLRFNSQLCSGCGYCEMACAMTRKGVASPSLALTRLKQNYRMMERQLFFCQHCDEPECVELCPAGAIARDDRSGLVTVDVDGCTGCELCLACSRGGMFYDRDAAHAANCDLCQGNPACVAFCPKGALVFESA